MLEMSCPIDGWADHLWAPFVLGGMVSDLCARRYCYYTRERHAQDVR